MKRWLWVSLALSAASCDKANTETGDKTAPAKTVVTSELALDFPGASQFAAVECEPATNQNDGCVSSWKHQAGWRADVLAMPIPPDVAPPAFVERVQNNAKQLGGTADFFAQGTQRVGRMLLPQDAGANVAISYLLPAPDGKALHILTTVRPAPEQVLADTALRDLLMFAAWVKPTAHAP
jgi:hypothetical protein